MLKHDPLPWLLGSNDALMRRGISDRRLHWWIGLAVCRALRRFEKRG